MKKNLFMMIIILAITGIFSLGCDDSKASKPCVVILGDSIFALSDDEAMYLEKLTGDSYRTYCQSGAQLVGGLVRPIIEQFKTAIADGPIRTIIMDGGGNDILIGANQICSADYGTELSPECYETMDKVLAAADQLISDAVASGVETAIYQGYYYVNNKQLWQVTDVFQAKAKTFIEEMNVKYAPAKIFFVDPREAFSGHSDYIIVDGIHPTAKGSEVLANLVYDTMIDNNIEQTPCP